MKALRVLNSVASKVKLVEAATPEVAERVDAMQSPSISTPELQEVQV